MSRWGVTGFTSLKQPSTGWGVLRNRSPEGLGWGCQLDPLGDGAHVARAGAAYEIDSPGNPWSVASSNGIDRMEVRYGDHWTRDVATSERCEFAAYNGFQPFDTVLWLSFAMRVTAATIDAPWTILGQFRAYDDPTDYASRSPMFAQELYAGPLFRVVTRSDPSDPSTGNSASVTRYEDTSFTLGVWHRFVYRLVFARTGNGSLAGWIDGVNVIPQAAIPMGSNDAFGPGWKYGVYRSAGGYGTTVAEYANLELGTTDLTARITSPLPIPS